MNIQNDTTTAGWKDLNLTTTFTSVNSYILLQSTKGNNQGSNTTMTDTVLKPISTTQYTIYLGAKTGIGGIKTVLAVGY